MRTIEWKKNKVRIIDQTRLPYKLSCLNLSTVDQVVKAIQTMQIRGAPAIGAAAAFGCVLGASNLKSAVQKLIKSRPTAVNLQWALERMQAAAKAGKGLSLSKLKKLLLKEELIRKGMRILTVCNTGALATVDYGTALGMVRIAHEAKTKLHVYVAETRPRLQGARLTAWELKRLKVPFTLITDNMIGSLMRKGEIDLVLVGADRIARNGDTANKIGTYSAAVLAKAHGIPFYVAAPLSTIDFNIWSGDEIVIEEREPQEVTRIGKEQVAPKGIKAWNPAFDVTPARYIKGIITERGIFKPENLFQVRKYGS